MAESTTIRQLYDSIASGDQVRQNLIALRDRIKDESLRRKFMYLLGGDFSILTGLLDDADPKVRKNAALILGQTEDEDVLDALVQAWQKEQTLFIREDYLKAMEGLDYEKYVPVLRKRLDEIEASAAFSGSGQAEDGKSAPDGTGRETFMKAGPGEAGSLLWDNGRHLAGEASRIRKMLERYTKDKKHTYTRIDPAPDLMLVCNRCQASATAEQILQGNVRLMKSGVFVKDGNLEEIMKIRTWSECLFTIPGGRPVPAEGKAAAEKLHEMKLYGYLKYLHGGEEGPYRYRVELRGRKDLMDRKGALIRSLASRLDMLEKGMLRNDDGSYEAELRLIERSDGTLAPMLKLSTLRDTRFAYRRRVTAQSMSPVNAALVLRLARPYLREKAQVLDPFCGTGTLLIERELIMPSGSCYGIDRFGDAIMKARENTGRIGHINYINRDFFDFTHDYLFGELITELPETLLDADFMDRFLDKAAQLLEDRAEVVVVTRKPEELERATERRGGSGQDYFLQKKFLLNERLGTTEIIFQFHRN